MVIAHSNEIARPIFKSQDQLFTLYQGDCNEVLPQFENQFDLIFADPPYFLSNDGLSIQSGKIVSVNKGDWDKEESVNDIDEFNYQWINNAKKALKNTGSLLISGTYHNLFSLGRILQKLDFKILNLITWQKTNPPPNFSCRYLTHSAEQIIWARKSRKHKHVFNYEVLKRSITTSKCAMCGASQRSLLGKKLMASTPLKNPSLYWCACF